jgi:jouberin
LPVFLKNENNLVVSYDKINHNHEYKESNLDFIPPFATPPYDLREKGESYAEWNEDFVINDDAGNLLNSNNIIFFEIMDFNFFIKRDDYIVPIAWGYLKPVGYSQTYLGKFKVQLYKYKYTQTEGFKKLASKYVRTPTVLFEFNWIKKEKYQTYLEVELTLENKPNENELRSMLYLQRKFRNTVFIPEGDEYVDKEILLTQSKQQLVFEEFDNQAYKKRRVLLLRRRALNEDCILPDRLLFKFNTSKLGCLTHEFSHDGRYLAAACTEMNSITTIKIFNVEEGVLRYHFKGHQQLIHQLVWSEDNQILLSASADNFVTLWAIPKDDSNNMENIEYQDNEKIFKLYSIPHPSYVYSVSIYPDQSNKEVMIIATASFDGFVRIFLINFLYDTNTYKHMFQNLTLLAQIPIFEEFTNVDFKPFKFDDNLDNPINETDKAQLLEKTVLEHRHPNSLIFDPYGRLFIGDSQGSIHLYEVRIVNSKLLCNKIKIINHKEIVGDNINNIMIEPKRMRLLVHSRDNCIRLLDISGNKPRVIIRYFGIKCSKTNIKSCVSPDGNYILSGSEEGKPFLWPLQSGINLPTDKYEVDFIDSVSDVSWNNCYNMIALSGFGQEYPLLIYVHEKKEISLDPNDFKLKNELVKDEVKNFTPMDDGISNFAKEYKTVIGPQLIDN